MKLIMLILFIFNFVTYCSKSVGATETVSVVCDGGIESNYDVIHFKSRNYPQPEINQLTHCRLRVNLTIEDIVLR